MPTLEKGEGKEEREEGREGGEREEREKGREGWERGKGKRRESRLLCSGIRELSVGYRLTHGYEEVVSFWDAHLFLRGRDEPTDYRMLIDLSVAWTKPCLTAATPHSPSSQSAELISETDYFSASFLHTS